MFECFPANLCHIYANKETCFGNTVFERCLSWCSVFVSEEKSGTLEPQSEKELKMKLSQKLAYGVGHVLNDICSALWFNYCLLFFEVVLKMPATIAGGLICLGEC